VSTVALNSALFAGLWVVAAWLGVARHRFRVLAGLVLLAVVATGLFRGVLVAEDVWSLHRLTDLDDAVICLLAWGGFGAAAACSGWRESSRWAPLMFGVICGELGGAVLAIQGVTDRGLQARRVMLASAGAMLSRVADPAVWLLVQGTPSWGTDGWGSIGVTNWCVLASAAVLGVALSWPMKGPHLETSRPPIVLVVGAVVWVTSWLPWAQLPVVLLGGAVLCIHSRARMEWDLLVRPALLVVVGLIAVAAGVAEDWAGHLEAQRIPYEAEHSLWIWLSGVTSGLVLGSDGGALVGRAVLDRALSLRAPMAPALWGLGAGVAGVAPYIVTGTLSRALPRHLAWIGVMTGLVTAMLWMGWLDA